MFVFLVNGQLMIHVSYFNFLIGFYSFMLNDRKLEAYALSGYGDEKEPRKKYVNHA